LRIAFVTPYLPSPANTGGRIRMYQLAQALASTAEVELFSCGGVREGRQNAARDELKIYRSTHVRNSDLGAVLPWLHPTRVRKACPARLARDLAKAHRRAPFDAVVVEHSYATATAKAVRDVPLVLDEHNIESNYYAEYYAAEAKTSAGRVRRQVELLRAWERRAWASAALVTCVADDDAKSIAEHSLSPIRVVPNGASVDRIEWIAPSRRESDDVLFIGLMSHAPNVEAAVVLAEQVMPRVWERRPSARLVLCGRSPERRVRALESSRVIVTGTVDSVQPYLSRAAVYANPLLRGAGSSLKVVEALASGVTLVSSAVGVRGYPLVDGRDYLGADEPNAMADAIARVLSSRTTFDAMSERGRAVASAFDWRSIGAAFGARVEAVARGARGSEIP
jgi:glycosyltransferase involved in cell wall biosynthesis